MLKPYLQLMRFHKPVGTLLVLWPTLWALWVAHNGIPTLKILIIFTLGAVIMRAAGCVINDIADRHFDCHVARTKERPLASKKIKTRQAIYLFCFLCCCACILVLMTNLKTILLAVLALITASLYPFMKRFTHWPQLILGIAFSFSIPMAFAAQNQPLHLSCWLLVLANIAWIIAYDTQYAITDQADDIKIGIKSTAILFGQYARFMIVLLQSVMLILLCVLGWHLHYTVLYFLGLFFAAILFCYQYFLIPGKSFQAFLNNQWVGLVIFLGMLL